MAMRKAFGLPASAYQDDYADRSAFAIRMPLNDMRQRLRAVLAGRSGMKAQRIQFKVQAAMTAHELWMLRSDLYECVARHHSRCEAARRIKVLLPCFDGWLPSRQLARIGSSASGRLRRKLRQEVQKRPGTRGHELARGQRRINGEPPEHPSGQHMHQ